MTTPFALLLRLSGLSQKEAVGFLNMSASSIDKFSRGVMQPKPGVLRDLRDLIKLQVKTADNALKQINALAERHGVPDEIIVGYPADSYEADQLGFTCVGAWWGMVTHVVAQTELSVRFVARGSEPATTVAIAQRER